MSHPARRLALLAPVALLVFAGCSSMPLRRSTAELPSPAIWVDDGHTIVNPVAITTNRAPIYPMALRRDGIEGLVVIDAVVDATGHVMLASIADSTHQAFNQSTLDAVRDWTFQPATRDGVPIAMAVRLPVGFAIQR